MDCKTSSLTIHNDQGMKCNQPILGHFMWPNERTIYDDPTLFVVYAEQRLTQLQSMV